MGRQHTSPFLALALGMQPAFPAAAADVSVVSLEITQGFQVMPPSSSSPGTPSNTVQLVAGRSSVVRATLKVGGSITPVTGIIGRLDLSVGGTAVASVLPDVVPFTAPTSPLRENEKDTLNFYVSGVGPSTDVDILVSITVPGDINTANNSLLLADLEFVAPEIPLIYYTGIVYPTVSTLPPDSSLIMKNVGEAMVKGIFPLEETRSDLYNPGLFSSLYFNDQWGLLNKIDGIDDLSPVGKDVDKLLSLLESCRLLIVAGGVGANDKTFLYGWLRDNPITGNGWASGCVGFGNTELARFQRTFAHEFMHMCRQDFHFNDMLDHVGWDIGPYLPGNPAGNNVLRSVKPTSLYDISTPDKLTNQAWIDQGTFEWFMTFGFSCVPGGKTVGSDSSEGALNVQGSFSADGGTLVELEPAFRFPWLVTTYPDEVEGPYRIEVTNNTGEVITRNFDPILGHDGDDDITGAVVRGFFSISIPVNGTADILRITDATGVMEYGSLIRSQSSPVVSITSPLAGVQIDDPYPILWNAMDADTPIPDLVYQVAYSPDNGSSFVPVAVDLAFPETLFEVSLVPQTNAPGTGLIRVFASDGLNTTYADVTGLTVAGILPPFVRGDVDGDGSVNITDPIYLLNYLFRGGAAPPCRAAADPNGGGDLDISDAVYILNYLFGEGAEPTAPFPRCERSEAVQDRVLGCSTAPTCP